MINYILGIATGIISISSFTYVKNSLNRLTTIEKYLEDFPSIDTMSTIVAKKILTMKLPVSELPENLQEMLKNETLPPSNKKINESYIG